MFLLTVAYLIPVASLLFMFFVLLRGDMRKQADARAFRVFLASLILWLSFLWFADQINHSESSIGFLKIAVFIGSFAPVTFFIFCQYFVRSFSKIITLLFLFIASIFALLALSNLMIIRLERGEVGIQIAEATPLYGLQTLYTAFAFGVSFLWLRIKAHQDHDPRIGNQVRFIIAGAIAALVVGSIGGFLNISGSNLLSPLAVAIFAASAFFAIFRHGLFDIRLVVARSAAYLLSLGLITSIFFFLIFGFSSAIIENRFSDSIQRAFYVFVTIMLVLSYPPLKKYFDRLTNRLFYRDAYEAQVLLNKLNTSLVSNIELMYLLDKSARIVSSEIKNEYCSFVILSKAKSEIRVFGMRHIEITNAELEVVTKRLDHTRKKTILATDLSPDNPLLETMQKHSLMAITKLVTRGGRIGYMLLGDKKSGNPYSREDVEILDIIGDELAIAIQNALRFEEIQRFNVTLQHKIDEATHQLRRANVRLKELDKTKDEFISMASHQLRTPLTAVKGYLSMVLEGDTGKIKSDQKELLQRAFDGADRMVYLISDLLNVSRLQSGKFVIENKPTDLIKLISAQVEQLQESAANHQLKLAFHKPANFPKQLMLDETKTQQVIMNFMDNAIYYTPAGGKVDVALNATDKEITYTVTDTGLGVPKAEQPHLFAKFYRAGNARKMRPDGTGLGLFMAKKVIVAQGGAIIFKSEEGKGSTFGFSFPRHKVEVKS